MQQATDIPGKDFLVPGAALKISGLSAPEPPDIHALEGAVVLLKQRMTAMEVTRAAQRLQQLAAMLIIRLAKVCASCTGCEEDCPVNELDTDDISLPGYLREAAGIPEGVKLCAEVDRRAGSVTITEAEYDHDLRDVPLELLERLHTAGARLKDLEKRIITEEVVYGA